MNSRSETYLQMLINGDTSDDVPRSRIESDLLALINKDESLVVGPQSRLEASNNN